MAELREQRSGLFGGWGLHSPIDWHAPVEGTSREDRNIEINQSHLHSQVEELLTRYGRIDTMWSGFSPDDKGAADRRSRALIPDPAVDSGTTTPGALPPGTSTLQLPVRRPDVAVPAIELFP
ncbi:hypothetical protein ABZ897_47105 [Nonomuraea sp. NPDC046802]|uniref:hypothetical protein n=1 Tax=Nonomuraea sp. NPDC046802 TaxID=3154919 RepID=UPI0033EC949E